MVRVEREEESGASKKTIRPNFDQLSAEVGQSGERGRDREILSDFIFERF